MALTGNFDWNNYIKNKNVVQDGLMDDVRERFPFNKFYRKNGEKERSEGTKILCLWSPR